MGEPIVLAVDDEAPILGIIRLTLETAGFQVLTATTGEDAIAQDRQHDPDAVLLDLVLPDISGMEVLRELRHRRPALPVVVITADVTKNQETLPDPSVEYLVKPFEPDELVAAVRQQIASPRGGGREARMLHIGELEIDPAKGVAAQAGIIIPFAPAERTLLKLLCEIPGKSCAAADLLVRTWGEEYRSDDEYLRLWISRLRQKIEVDPENPRLVVQGDDGYRLDLAGTGGAGSAPA